MRRKSGRRAKQRSHRRIRHHQRGISGPLGKFGSFLKGLFRKPVSHVVAPAIGLAAVLQLLFTPLSNGDSWVGRLMNGIQAMRSGGGPAAILQQDPAGGNLFNTMGAQLIQNAMSAAVTGIGAAITYKIGRLLGM